MKTVHTKIDVHIGTLIMEFDRESICFNIFKIIRYTNYINSSYYIDVVDSCIEHVFELEQEDTLQVALHIT